MGAVGSSGVRRLWIQAIRLVPAVVLLVVSAGLLLRWTVRDRWEFSSWLYYATPPVVLALSMALTAGIWWQGGRRRAARLAVVVSLLFAVWHLAESWHWSTSEPDSQLRQSHRVVFWNAARGWFGWSSLADRLRDFDADLICLVESKRLDQRRGELEEALPGYDMAFVPGGFTYLVRGRILAAERLDAVFLVASKARLRLARGAVELEVGLVDIPSKPLSGREWPFTGLNWAYRGAYPDLLLGDFNTPRSSLHFAHLRETHRHAFEVAGDGMAETWPVFLPLLDLDQIWVGPGLQPLSCRHQSGWASDHRAVVLDLVLPGS